MLLVIFNRFNRVIFAALASFLIVNPVLHADVTRPRYAKSWKDECPIDLDKLVLKLQELEYSGDKEHMFNMLKHMQLIYKKCYGIRLDYRKIARTQEQLDVISEYEDYWNGMKVLHGYVPRYDSRIRTVYATDDEIEAYRNSDKKENSAHVVWGTTICLIGGAMMAFPPTRAYGFYLFTTGGWHVSTYCMDEYDRMYERGHYKNLDRDRDRGLDGGKREINSHNLERRERRDNENFYRNDN